jgi:glutamine synthetase
MNTTQIVPEVFLKLSCRVFSDKVMRGLVPIDVYDAFQLAKEEGKQLTKDQAEEIAKQMSNWALQNGCTTFTHWFSPMRGSNAEKYESLLDINYKTGDLKIDFCARKLFLGETDGSSFPQRGNEIYG